jgi:hypothetical protein
MGEVSFVHPPPINNNKKKLQPTTSLVMNIVIVDGDENKHYNEQNSATMNSISCHRCRLGHRKCDKLLPICSRCKKLGVECVYKMDKRKRDICKPNPESSTGLPMEPLQKKSGPNPENTAQKVTNSNMVSLDESIDAQEGNIDDVGVLLNETDDIIDACSKIYAPSELGIPLEDIIMAFRPQIFSSKALPVMFPDNEQLLREEKTNQALWFALQAVVLRHLQSKSSFNIDYVKEKYLFTRSLRSVLRYLQLNTDNDGQLILHEELIGKFSREQLVQASDQMYNIAKSILLDPLIFPHITNDHKLAEVCTLLSNYSVQSGIRFEESEMFLRYVKSYIKRAKDLLEIDPDSKDYNGLNRELLEKQQTSLLGLIDAYLILKPLLWYLTHAFKQKDFFSNTKWFKKYLKLSIKEVGKLLNKEVNLSFDTMSFLSKNIQSLQRILEAISNDQDDLVTQLIKVRKVCNELRKIPAQQIGIRSDIWKFKIYAFESFAMEIASHNNLLQKEQMLLANDIYRELSSNLLVAMCGGTKSLIVIMFFTRIHLQHSIKLCMDTCTSDANLNAMIESLKILQNDLSLVEALNYKFNIPIYHEVINKIRLQIDMHKWYLSKMPSTLQVQTQQFNPPVGMENMETQETDNRSFLSQLFAE